MRRREGLCLTELYGPLNKDRASIDARVNLMNRHALGGAFDSRPKVGICAAAPWKIADVQVDDAASVGGQQGFTEDVAVAVAHHSLCIALSCCG